MITSRADRSLPAEWVRTIDSWFLGAILLLICLGLVLSFAASPAVAERIGVGPMHFVEMHFLFLAPALLAMIVISFFTPLWVRRVAVLGLAAGIVLLVATLLFGIEVKGSRRWISLFGQSLQPSEFVKPAFVVVCAWLFSLRETRPGLHGDFLALGLFAVIGGLLILQPDFGQTMLVGATWGVMFFLAGLPWVWIAALIGIAAAGGFIAYVEIDHVASRVDRFLTGEGDTFQADTAIRAVQNGGWLGQGPGEGTVKQILPDSHTDFVFAVAGEEFGVIVCGLIALTFFFIVMRGLAFAFTEEDAFKRLAVAGLVTNIGLQALINMAVNLHLVPPKGMTLPLISYGGSSMIAVAIGMGMLLALTRKRPDPMRAARERPLGAVMPNAYGTA
jgi:cell division protein FtsW